jgi:SAM-dependent methyltransferase
MCPLPAAGKLPHNKACELEDFRDIAFRAWVAEIFPHEIVRFGPSFPTGTEYRKHWEVAMAARALHVGGALAPEAEVLGVGAGNEPTLFWLTRHVRRVFATDLYAAEGWAESAMNAMLVDPSPQWPGEWHPRRLVVQHMNALDLRYDDESFDGVFSSSSIEHFGDHGDVVRAVDEMFRVLRPGGILALSTELKVRGPGHGIPGVLLFTPDELVDLLIGTRLWEPIDPPRFSVSDATLATARPFPDSVAEVQRHVAEHGEIRFHHLDWDRYPQIVLQHEGYVWTSVQIALRKRMTTSDKSVGGIASALPSLKVSGMPRPLRRVISALSRPARNFLNQRFEATTRTVQASTERLNDVEHNVGDHLQRVEHNVNIVKDLVANDMHASNETARVFGSYLSDLVGAVEDLRRLSSTTNYLEHMATGSIQELTAELAQVLNFAQAADGFAAQANLWFNQPLWIEFIGSGAGVGGVNERIVEIPYVFRALGQVPQGAEVLDVGSSESLVAVELASLGYRVTGIDPREGSLAHPNLERIVGSVEEWRPDRRFDAVVCLSTIEHLGLGAYGQPKCPDADVRAMRRLHELSRPDALLILTTPFGVPAVDELQRTYDAVGLKQLLEGWEVTEMAFARRLDAITWQRCQDVPNPVFGERYVALVTARRQP